MTFVTFALFDFVVLFSVLLLLFLPQAAKTRTLEATKTAQRSADTVFLIKLIRIPPLIFIMFSRILCSHYENLYKNIDIENMILYNKN